MYSDGSFLLFLLVQEYGEVSLLYLCLLSFVFTRRM